MNSSTALHMATRSSFPTGLPVGISGMEQPQERRLGESSLSQKRAQGERANHDKSRFLAEASHDLRQPIHALGLYIAELRRKVSGEEQQYLVRQVERSVDVITTLINSLLDISRLDAGVIVPQKRVCDISELLDRIASDFQMEACARNIRLVVRRFHGLAISDPVLLERIVVNLVSNALQYTQPFGTVLIRCRRRGQHVSIEVRDNGIGIEKSCQADIFREFFQLSPHQLGTQKGLGLGLAIVDRLVRLLDHKIELRSAPDNGSCFSVRLDSATAADGSIEVAIASEIEGLPLTGKKLLIVDGDGLVLDGTARILASWGCEISAVSSLNAVKLRLMDGESWDLVISDYQLDCNATGIDVIKTVRQHLKMQTPCILISGDTSASLLELAEDAGHALLHKPVKPAKLRSLLQFLLEDAAVTD